VNNDPEVDFASGCVIRCDSWRSCLFLYAFLTTCYGDMAMAFRRK